MKVWITTWALTEGIIEVIATICESTPSMIEWVSKHGYPMYSHGDGKNWHRTRESAVAKALDMKAKKLKSIDASRKRIEKLEFK